MKEYLTRIYNKSKKEFYQELEIDLENNNKKFIITVNPETLMLSEEDRELKEILDDNNNILTPDGIAIVRTCIKINNNVKERIAGIDIAEYLLGIANQNNYSVYLFGAKEYVIESLINKLKQKYPNINILGYSNGYIKDKDNKMDEIIELKPDIILIAMGIPIQEKLIYKHFKKAKKGIFVGIGGSFDVLSGTKKRAPRLFINLKLEWLYRIVTEPNRLKRFYQYNIKFLFKTKGLKKD